MNYTSADVEQVCSQLAVPVMGNLVPILYVAPTKRMAK